MSDESMKYIMVKPLRYDIDQHVPALEKAIPVSPHEVHLPTLREYAIDDEALLYKMVVRFVPLNY